MKKGQRQCLTSPDRQLRKHEKTVQKPCSGWSCGWSCNGSFGGSSGLRSARSRNSQTPAGFKPNLSKNQPPKNCLTSPSDAHKKDEEGQRQCLTSPDRQLRKHEKTMQKPCSGWSCGWSCNGTFGGSSGLRSARSRNSQTPAGFKPNLSKNQPPKKCLTSPSDAHKKDEERPTPMPAGCEHTPRKTHAKKLFHVTFGTHKKQTLLWSGSETPMPKNSFTSPLELIKNNALPMRKP